MMERVEHVAGEFRKAAHSQMAATTQRTIRSVMVMVQWWYFGGYVIVVEELQFKSLIIKF